MIIKVRHDGPILVIEWWPTGDPWNVWSVTKMIDMDTLKPMEAFVLGSPPSRMTAKSIRQHIRQLELARSIMESLDRAIGTWDAIKVMNEEIDVLPISYGEWPWQEPILVARSGQTGRTEIKYQMHPDNNLGD